MTTLSERYELETYRMRGTATRRSDYVHTFKRKATTSGRVYSFTTVIWGDDNSVSYTVREGDTTNVVHEFTA